MADPVMVTKVFPRKGCGQEKELHTCVAAPCTHELRGERRAHKRCYACQFPKCCIPGCSERPPRAISKNHIGVGSSCICFRRKHPHCSMCKITPRTVSAISGKLKFKDWVCACCKHTPGVAPTEEQQGASPPQTTTTCGVCVCKQTCSAKSLKTGVRPGKKGMERKCATVMKSQILGQ